MRQYRVVVSQQCHRIASFLRLVLSQISGTVFHCYLGNAVLDAYEHIGSLKREEYFRTWIVRILINRCTKKYRSNQRKAYLEDYSEEAVCDAGKADVEFREMLSVLPDDSRVIFQLYFGEQFTVREIAQALDMNENTVKSRLHRGKEQLRDSLEGKADKFA